MKTAFYTFARNFFSSATLALLLALPALAWAQTSTTAEVKKPPPGFERVAGAPDTEKVHAPTLVVIAYAAFFGGMFGYLVLVVKKQSEMAKEFAELAERLKKLEKR